MNIVLEDYFVMFEFEAVLQEKHDLMLVEHSLVTFVAKGEEN